jgi:N4-gp56 family major capsid protein
MSTQAYPPSGGVGPVRLTDAGGGNTSAPRSNFIPALWSDEILASYKQNLVLAPLVANLNHNGKKGDTIYVPAPVRGAASAKAAGTAVTLQYNSELAVRVVIDKHYEYSRLIEDIVGVQALPTLRAFYVNDAGYQLAVRVDRHISLLWHYLNNGNTTPAAANLFETAVIGSDGTTAFGGQLNTNTGNAAALTDAGIRRMIQTLDDNDVPQSERVLVIPPVEKKNLMGIPRFTEQAFVGEVGGGNTIRNGLIGDVYGIPIYVTSNCPYVHINSVTGTQSATFSSAAPTGASYSDEFSLTVDWNTSSPTDSKVRIGALLHKSALVLIEQMSVRSQVQYKQEYLADLLTADTIYGVGRLRDGTTQSGVTTGLATAGIAFATPA